MGSTGIKHGVLCVSKTFTTLLLKIHRTGSHTEKLQQPKYVSSIEAQCGCTYDTVEGQRSIVRCKTDRRHLSTLIVIITVMLQSPLSKYVARIHRDTSRRQCLLHRRLHARVIEATHVVLLSQHNRCCRWNHMMCCRIRIMLYMVLDDAQCDKLALFVGQMPTAASTVNIVQLPFYYTEHPPLSKKVHNTLQRLVCNGKIC